MLYDLTYMWNLKKKENQELVVGEVEGDRNEGLLARGTKISGHGGSI